jgi:chemotaxis protein MotB
MPLRAPKGFIDETDPKVCQIGHPAPPWLVNYADLMTELVCFFVILYALSAALNKNIQAAAQQVSELIEKKEMAGSVKVDKEGLKITLEEQGKASFFSSGSSETTPEIDSVIQKLAPTLRKLSQDHDVIVEGHTDSQQVRGALTQYFDSNWELSAARATSVARLLIDKYGLPPNHVGAVGYGEFRPIASNETPEGRAQNRRVVFFIKNIPSGGAAAPMPGRIKHAAAPPTVPAASEGAASVKPAEHPAPAEPAPATPEAPSEPSSAAPGQTGAAE